MKKVILYIAESLDGYVATNDGSVAWLDEFNNVPGIDNGYAEIIKNRDTDVQGNLTIQQFKDKPPANNDYVITNSPEKQIKDAV